MRKFLKKGLLFSIPLIILIVPPVFVLLISSENFKDIDGVIKNDDKYIIGYAYNEENYNYLKWKTLTRQEPFETVALGSSRVLQFRRQMFTSTFYNAGYTISSINDFLPFLESIPKENYPKYLIIGLDQWMFNDAYDNLSESPDIDLWATSFKKTPTTAIIKNVWKDLFNKKYGINTLVEQDPIMHIGLNAKVNNTGFRNDGSMYYGQQIQRLLNNDSLANDYHFNNTKNRINKGIIRFQYGSEVNNKALLKLDELLSFCKEHNIFVIGFLPPFADEIYEMGMSSGNYKLWPKIPLMCLPIFEKYNFEFYDFSNMALCNSDDTEAIDGFHGGESTYLRLLIKILKNNSVLNRVSSIEKLNTDLNNRIDRYNVYGYIK